MELHEEDYMKKFLNYIDNEYIKFLNREFNGIPLEFLLDFPQKYGTFNEIKGVMKLDDNKIDIKKIVINSAIYSNKNKKYKQAHIKIRKNDLIKFEFPNLINKKELTIPNSNIVVTCKNNPLSKYSEINLNLRLR